MTGADAEVVVETLRAASTLHQQMATGELSHVLAASTALVRSLRGGGKVLSFGNGGSAADAQHFAAELVGRFERQRGPLAAVALTTDASVLTAIANDDGYEAVFARQVEALGRPGDVAMGITTSGRSPNVVAALRVAAAKGMTAIAVTGAAGGPAAAAATIHIAVPSGSTPRVQEVHRTVLHILCDLVERHVADGGQQVVG